jgi:hypothetical protein
MIIEVVSFLLGQPTIANGITNLVIDLIKDKLILPPGNNYGRTYGIWKCLEKSNILDGGR